MSYDAILSSTKDRVTTITLNRPEKRNALNAQLVGELQDAFEAAKSDDTKVIVLKANGAAFSAGADLAYIQQLQDFTAEQNLEDSQKFMNLLHSIYTHPKPVIADVRGAAIAGGCGLVTVCDFAIATEQARFGYSEVRIGFVPALVMVFLVKRVGEATARKLMLTGDLISAEEADNAGLITKAVWSDQIEEEVEQLTTQLLEGTSAESAKRIKTMLAEQTGMSLKDALNYAAEMNAGARSTGDFKQGIESFLNKTKLSW